MRSGYPAMNFPASVEDPRHTDLICDDAVEIAMQYSTHWDSLAHVGQLFDTNGDGKLERVYYNGFRACEHVIGSYDFETETELPEGATLGAKRLGIENMAEACVQGRAVMVDFEAHFGREHKRVCYDDFMRILERDKVDVEKGDFLCMHTGFARLLIEAAGNPDPQIVHNSCAALDGRDIRIQNWITDTGVVAMIADNPAVEFTPSRVDEHVHQCSKLPMHEHCLFRLGVYLGELWFLSDLNAWLRANGRNRFLLTAPPLRFPGAVGSPLTPVGTV
jgi:kynurenine formamidase